MVLAPVQAYETFGLIVLAPVLADDIEGLKARPLVSQKVIYESHDFRPRQRSRSVGYAP